MTPAMEGFFDYSRRLQAVLAEASWVEVATLANELFECWKDGRQVFLCGNGGSAGNAIHIANDLIFGVSRCKGHAIRVTALPSNSAVLTCLANDQGYEDTFSHQLAVLARKGDVLVALSGSGNSPNIIKVLEQAREMGIKSFAVLGFSGGKAKGLADVPIHFEVNDMQIAEDLQLVVGHMVMQWLYENKELARS